MHQDHGLSRRALLGAGAGLAAGAALGTGRAAAATGPAAAAAPAKRSLLPPDRIGVMLYSLRDDIAEHGFARVLETVAEIGYKQVELAGYTQGSSPEITVRELRALLDANGLVAAGSHVSPSDDASLAQILDDAEVLGIPQVGLSLLAPSGAPTVAGWTAAAEQYNRWGEIASRRGIGFYLHNHFQEFLPTADDPGRRGYDVLLAATDPRFVSFQLDVFWAYAGREQSGGAFDPLTDYAIPHRDRFPLLHVKDGLPERAQFTDAGEGRIDFQAFFTALFAAAPGEDRRHLYLWERDNAGEHPRGGLAAARSSFVNLRHGLWAPGAPAADAPAGGGLAATVGDARFRRAGGRRVLEVPVRLDGDAEVTVRLVRRGRTLAEGRRSAGRRTRRVRLALPASVAPGDARLSVTVTQGADAYTARDGVRVPRP